MANIVEFKANAPFNADLVERLERLLADAKAGNIQQMSYACVRRDHVRMTGWSSSPDTYAHDAAAALMELFWRKGQSLFEGEEAEPL